MMDSGLGMVQTSNGIPNNELLDLITPKSLLAWHACGVRNTRSANNGTRFSKQRHQAHMSTSIWLLTSPLRPGAALQPGTLWVVEEILDWSKAPTKLPPRTRLLAHTTCLYAEVYERSGYSQLFSENMLHQRVGYDGGGTEYTIGAHVVKFFDVIKAALWTFRASRISCDMKLL